MAFEWASRLFLAAPTTMGCVVTDDGLLILIDTHNPEAEPIDAAVAVGYLQQLAGEERLQEAANGLLLPWDEVYDILDTPAGEAELSILALPSVRQLVPRLRSEGSLTSESFAVGVDGWREGAAMDRDDVSCVGGLANIGEERAMLPKGSYRVMVKLREFYAKETRTPEFNRTFWGSMRQEAVQAGAILDQFLYSNVILTPEKLTIELQRNTPGGIGVVEVEPWFAGAPDNWIDHFDSFTRVRDLYEIPTKDGIVQVVITPKVKPVLQAIKKMPGRRVAGSLGERFVTNPMATLGGAADGVIDPEQFERARQEAGIVFKRFAARVTTDDDGAPTQVGIQIQAIGENAAWSNLECFADANELRRFITAADVRLATENELYHWRGHDLQLLGDTHRELETLKLAFDAWTRRRITIRYADVSDLTRYSPRVEGIGVQKPLTSPYIPREGMSFNEDQPFTEKQVKTVVVNVPTSDGAEVPATVTPADLKTVRDLLAQAQSNGDFTIEWPDTGKQVSVSDAEEVVAQVEEVWEAPADSAKNDTGNQPERRAKSPRQELLLRSNVESTKYREDRAEQLKFDPSRPRQLPRSMLPGVKLKDHQVIGVSWLQNLIEQAPNYCRGAILADDMGLGKTLQLLTVIAALLEQRKDARPVLVVAPVSLLENWKEEAERFFQPGTFSLLTLYGDTLSSLREGLASLDEQLHQEQLLRFLKPGWLGPHKVVLTTYETLRDLEFSLAAVRWSLMICDEAQKIKNPAAMVTRSAMKQNVDFKIACTGTPVENSLADLWCLFDYIQPGLLGGLNEFGDRYRRPIEGGGDPEAQARIDELRAIIEPQILRRMKKEVAQDLPDKFEKAHFLSMSAYQKRLYAEAIETYRNRGTPEHGANFVNVLSLIHYLRQVCTDPKEVGKNVFVPLPVADYRQKSPKLDWLLKALTDIKGRSEKVIVFCEFREMQRMLVHYIEQVFKYRPDVINGDTSTSAKHEHSRQKRIKAFQAQPGFGVIILSPVAVGFGVNIQAANHVIHYSRTWNPAKEDQATDRAYRIGQTKPVYVYYPVIRAEEFKSFDEKLHELLEYKRSISGDMLKGTGNILPSEFDEVVGVGRTAFEDRIDLDTALTLQPDYFEGLIAALWVKKGFKTVIRTPASNDDGVDVVAKTQKRGELIQCKSSSTLGQELDWDAVKDVVTGHAAYRLRYPGTQFKLLCITNQFFNDNTRRMADLNDVKLIDQYGLKTLLAEHRVVMRDLEQFLTTRTLAF